MLHVGMSAQVARIQVLLFRRWRQVIFAVKGSLATQRTRVTRREQLSRLPLDGRFVLIVGKCGIRSDDSAG